jgi:hypothetical protein
MHDWYIFSAWLMHSLMIQVDACLMHLFMVQVDYRLYNLMHGLGYWYRLFGVG